MPAKSDDSPVGEEGRNDPEAAGELFDESLLVDGAVDVADVLATLRQGFVTQFRFDGPCGPNSVAWMYANAAAAIRRLAAERDQWKLRAEEALMMLKEQGDKRDEAIACAEAAMADPRHDNVDPVEKMLARADEMRNKTVKTCETCRFYSVFFLTSEPCVLCQWPSRSKWQPKE